MKYIRIFTILFLMVAYVSCTKLEERFRGELEQSSSGSITAGELLVNAYSSLNGPFQTGDFWHLQEHTSDEAIGPTRGPDWDDNGQWRALHAHTWNADHGIVNGGFTNLLATQFAASNVLEFNPSAQQAAEARFIRALSIFGVLDLYDQVPFRDNLTDFRELPRTLRGIEAADFIISELNDVMSSLPTSGPGYVATQNAAKALLMKTYLNRGVYANRASPTFDGGDMTQVITLADQIIASGQYSINPGKYYDNFAPNNDVISTENIFTLYNQNGQRGGNMQGNWYQIAHYNMNPGGWNGFATLSDFYDKFEAGDERRGKNYVYPGALPNPGNRQNVGFLIGQQYNMTTDAALQDRKGNPLTFSRAVAIRETDPNTLERTGVRGLKYPYDYSTSGDQKNNDWAVFRFADVLLMKAEAQVRSGNAAGALLVVNQLRTVRSATPMLAVTTDDILNERGRELYWEGWRRHDLIRFGKYLNPWQEKPSDDPKNLLFPIPNSQLAVNPNLEQNSGYN